jgi:hypothetical protein
MCGVGSTHVAPHSCGNDLRYGNDIAWVQFVRAMLQASGEVMLVMGSSLDHPQLSPSPPSGKVRTEMRAGCLPPAGGVVGGAL